MASGSRSSPSRPTTVLPVTPAPDGEMKPVLFEIFGEMWKVQARLGQGGSASVYRVSSGRANSAAVKEFQADPQGGDYGFLKERTVLEDIQGHKNIGRLEVVFILLVTLGSAVVSFIILYYVYVYTVDPDHRYFVSLYTCMWLRLQSLLWFYLDILFFQAVTLLRSLIISWWIGSVTLYRQKYWEAWPLHQQRL